jgi:transcriptional regulator with XRE-family HTH domain
MESRIKKLREKRGLIQAILAAELGITQSKRIGKIFQCDNRLSIRTVRCEKRFDWANQNERNHR